MAITDTLIMTLKSTDQRTMKETPSSSYILRTERNVRDSDGTVVFSIAPVLTGSSQKTIELAHKHHKPVMHTLFHCCAASHEAAATAAAGAPKYVL